MRLKPVESARAQLPREFCDKFRVVAFTPASGEKLRILQGSLQDGWTLPDHPSLQGYQSSYCPCQIETTRRQMMDSKTLSLLTQPHGEELSVFSEPQFLFL